MLNEIPLSPPFHIAIIGGGQLGKMMTVAAKQLGFYVTILDPTPGSPAAQVANCQVIAAFDDGNAISQLVAEADVTTYEFEHIDSISLEQLEERGHKIFPTPKVLKIIQDKLLQKQSLVANGIPVPPFRQIFSAAELVKAAGFYGYPFLLKSCTGGYDGKGNLLVENSAGLKAAEAFIKDRKVLAEQFIPFVCEISVLTVRDRQGNIKSYPISENQHEDNILRKTIVPARISDQVARKAQQMAEKVISVFSGVGLFCIEMFVTEKGEVLVNEVAPRPHNSGHYTIEGCVTSQFEQHIRAITGLPLGDTTLLRPTVMVNILGEEGHNGRALLTGCSEALAFPEVHLHFYGKILTSANRKMGHITITGDTLHLALSRASEVARVVHVIAEENKGGNQ